MDGLLADPVLALDRLANGVHQIVIDVLMSARVAARFADLPMASIELS